MRTLHVPRDERWPLDSQSSLGAKETLVPYQIFTRSSGLT
jgi:hypothetical protein